MSPTNLVARQIGGTNADGPDGPDFNGDDNWVWYAVKWAIIAAIFAFFLVFFVGGYLHAKRRMKKGLPLLAYHRWIVPRTTRARYERGLNPQQNNHSYYNSSHLMHPYGGAPPPAYNPETDYVPPYSPPAGSSKANPDQHTNIQEVGGADQHPPPPGPPPSRTLSGELGEGSGLRQPPSVASPPYRK